MPLPGLRTISPQPLNIPKIMESSLHARRYGWEATEHLVPVSRLHARIGLMVISGAVASVFPAPCSILSR
jgi:hypothetical protein